MFERHGRVIPILALATAGSLWGTGFFGKVALSEMPVATMVLFRFVFACAGLLPFIFFDRPRFAGAEWGWGSRCIRPRSACSVPRPVQRTLPHHGFARFPNGRHVADASRHRSRVLLRGAAALRGLACACSFDIWRCVDRVVE